MSPDLYDYPPERFYGICVDLNTKNSLEKAVPAPSKNEPLYMPYRELPNVWILTSKEFKKYGTSGHRLPIYERSKRHKNKERYLLLKKAYRAWERLTEG